MPQVEVHIVPSLEAPSGVGEPGVPPVAPAVINTAIFSARQEGDVFAPRVAQLLRGV